MIDLVFNSPLQEIKLKEAKEKEITVFVKRDDLIHPEISGNKWRKLKYNLIKTKAENKDALLTFGGAFSNHIAATAVAGEKFGIKTIGIIRGEKITPLNPTLSTAEKYGMHLKFISRDEYTLKTDSHFIHKLRNEFGSFHLVPEGGANFYGINGCIEIVNEIDKEFDFVCTAIGTGTTISGLSLALNPQQKALGFPVLKPAESFKTEVEKLLERFNYDDSVHDNFEIITDYHFGGYAKINEELIQFIQNFYRDYGIKLDPVYTGKMFYGVVNLIKKGYFPKGSRLVLLHTGGIQGIEGMEKRYRIKIF